MEKKPVCLSQCAGTDPDPSRERRCPVIYHERQMSSPWEESDGDWDQFHPSLAVLMVAEGCCLSQQSFEPLGEVQLFSSCTSPSWSTFSSFLQSCPVQQASQGWRTSSPAWALWKWLIYYNTGRERKKDSGTQPSLGLEAISGSGGKERTKSSETPQSGFLQDLNISNWNGPLFAPGCSYSLNVLTFKGSIQEPWYLSVKANLEGIFANGQEFYRGFYLPDLHFISAQVVCSAGSVYDLLMVPHLTSFLSLVLRRSTDKEQRFEASFPVVLSACCSS